MANFSSGTKAAPVPPFSVKTGVRAVGFATVPLQTSSAPPESTVRFKVKREGQWVNVS